MSCGDWLIKYRGNGYAVYENHKCYAVVLSKKHYDKHILEILEAVIK